MKLFLIHNLKSSKPSNYYLLTKSMRKINSVANSDGVFTVGKLPIIIVKSIGYLFVRLIVKTKV